MSARDFVPWVDNEGRLNNSHTCHSLWPHKDAEWLDHSFISPTFDGYKDEAYNNLKTRN